MLWSSCAKYVQKKRRKVTNLSVLWKNKNRLKQKKLIENQ